MVPFVTLSAVISVLVTAEFFSTSQALDQWDALGFGVFPFGGTYNHKHLKGRVLDLGPLITSFDGTHATRMKVTEQSVDNRFETTHTGKGFTEFSRRLQRDISVGGGFKGFEASASVHYTFSTVQRSDYYFSRLSSVVEKAQLRVSEVSTSGLQALVIPSVASYLSRASPQDIFRSYGSHVTTHLVIGGMLELWSSSLTTKFTSEEEYKVSVKASFKKFVRGEASLTSTENIQALKVESSEGLIVHGGTFRRGENGVSEWEETLRQNSQEIQYFGTGAIPIWELISDQAQAFKVQSWYYGVFGDRSMIVKEFASPPLSNVGRYHWPEAQIYVPRGWKVISGGAQVQFFGHGQMLTKSYPIMEAETAVGWKVQSKDHLEADLGKIRAFAIALWDPFHDWDVKVAKSYSTSAQHPSTTAILPSGYALVGGGADAKWRDPGSLLVDNYPSSSRSWLASSKDHLKGVSSTVDAYAIGIRPSQGGEIYSRIKSLNFGPAAHPGGTIYATSDSKIIGGGARVQKGGVGNMLVNCYPRSNGDSFFASSKDHLKADPKVITVYGIEIRGAVFVEDVGDVLGVDPSRF